MHQLLLVCKSCSGRFPKWAPCSLRGFNRKPRKCHPHLDLRLGASQTFHMAHTYMLFDFGADEEKAQQARHKLEGWKQAFRLDKKLQVKFDRGEAGDLAPEPTEAAEVPKKAGETKAKPKARSKSSEEANAKNGSVKLLVRLYFSAHEKLSEQQWLGRIPADELFKGADPKVIREGQPEFADVLKQFDSLE
jgi:hypothetical protein